MWHRTENELFQKLSKVFRNVRISLGIKKKKWYVLYTSLYYSEYWIISPQIRKKNKDPSNVVLQEYADNSMCGLNKQKPNLKKSSNRKNSYTQSPGKKNLDLLGRVMRKEGFENLIFTRHIEGKKDKGRQWATYLTSRTSAEGGYEIEEFC